MRSKAIARFDDTRLTARQKLHKLTAQMADVLAILNEEGPLSGEQLEIRLRAMRRSGLYVVTAQGIGSSLTGLSSRRLVEIERYGMGASCVWRATR